MSVRISAGTLKHRVLKVPRGQTTRPTSAKVREAVFSILGSVEGLRVLDLYAGTGALGIEALSRGAHTLVLVERDAVAAQCIRDNLKALEIEGSAYLLQHTVEAALRRLPAGQRRAQDQDRLPAGQRRVQDQDRLPAGQRRVQEPTPEFDLVFADPPWAESTRARESLGALSRWLSDTARVVYEHARGEEPVIRGLTAYDRRTWGDTGITFFKASPREELEPPADG